MRLFSNWGIELLVGQLYDQSRSVALTALSILDEACEDKVCSSDDWYSGQLSVYWTGPVRIRYVVVTTGIQDSSQYIGRGL